MMGLWSGSALPTPVALLQLFLTAFCLICFAKGRASLQKVHWMPAAFSWQILYWRNTTKHICQKKWLTL
ncbi:UNVERIFIED_CONTAM: hypothetical protein GTU68_055111 [Idotea baltica]|nr:hypothetical protein [Idotea baltica]